MEKVYLATDNDGPGIALREELSRRVGKHKCWIVNFPEGCKDANDVLVKYGAFALAECHKNATPYPLPGILEVKDMSEDIDYLYEHGFPVTQKLGYPYFDTLVGWVRRMLVIVSGIPSSGKSDFMDQIYIRLASRHGWKFGIFSAENKPDYMYFAKLAEKYIGKPFHGSNRMSILEKEAAKVFIGEHFFFVNENEMTVSVEGLLKKAKELISRKGIDCFIIDPWNRVEHDMGDVNENQYIGEKLTEIYKFKEENDVSVVIVAHPTKMKKDLKTQQYLVPTLYDINGSAHWNNRADVGLTVYRHFDPDNHSNLVDVHIQKVRHKWVGRFGAAPFEYDVPTGRYKEPTQRLGYDTEYSGIKVIENEHGYPKFWDK